MTREPRLAYRPPAMFSHRLALAALIVLMFATTGLSAGEPSIVPEPGLLVLRNGRILEGRIIRVGDRFRVALGAEDEVSLPATQVEFHCRDLREAYQLKRAASRPDRVQEVLDLADWCLQHDLFREAAEQLLDAHGLDPTAPRLRVLERRLQVALDEPKGDEEIPSATLPRPTVTADEVRQALEGLPPGSVEWYTSRVQPLLLNRCAAGRCHGGHSGTGFRLEQPSQGHRLTTRVTQRNLFHTLQHVDREDPAASRLLAALEQPHADLPGPVFGEHEAEMRRLLRDWVYQLAGAARRAPPQRLAEAAAAGPQPMGSRRSLRVPFADPAASGPARSAHSDPRGPSGPAAVTARAGRSPDTVAPAHTASQVSRADYEAPLGDLSPSVAPAGATAPWTDPSRPGAAPGQIPPGSFQPRDPFDPEIFNRRYLPQGAAPR